MAAIHTLVRSNVNGCASGPPYRRIHNHAGNLAHIEFRRKGGIDISRFPCAVGKPIEFLDAAWTARPIQHNENALVLKQVGSDPINAGTAFAEFRPAYFRRTAPDLPKSVPM